MKKVEVKTGDKYGRLAIIKELIPRKRWRREFVCKCECGSVLNVTLLHLRNGHTKSCGCLKNTNVAARNRPFEWVFNKLKRSNWYVDLTYEEFLEFTNVKNCHYCGKYIIWNEFVHNKSYLHGYNIDRKNTNIGYTKDNCVVCCPRCNWAKQDQFTYNEWVKIGKVIMEFGNE